MGLQPQVKKTAETALQDQIAKLFQGALGGTGGNQLAQIFQRLSIPQYGGQYAAPLNPTETGALDLANQGLNISPALDIGNQAATGLAGIAGQNGLPPELQSLLDIMGGGGPGGDVLTRLTQPQNYGQDALSAVAASSPDFSSIENLLGGQSNSPLAQFLNVQTPERSALAAMGTAGPDYQGILAALDQARQASLGRNLRDVSERFSASGLRGSTDLANALGQTANESESSFLGQAAQLLPQLASLKQSALGTAGQLGLGGAQIGAGAAGGLANQATSLAQTLGQLNLGARGQTGDILSQLANINLQGTGQQLNAGQILGQLGLGAGGDIAQFLSNQGGQQLSALQSLPGVANLLAMLPSQVANQTYGIGAQAQQSQDVELQRRLNEFMRTQGALFGPIVGYGAGAPQIVSPGKGSQLLGAGATVGAAAAGK